MTSSGGRSSHRDEASPPERWRSGAVAAMGRALAAMLALGLLAACAGSNAELLAGGPETGAAPRVVAPVLGGLADLPVNTFVALQMPGLGQGIPGQGMKHVTWAFNPENSRLYATGGDYEGEPYQQSYRQETWSLSLAERWANRVDPAAGWRLEYPYCGPRGQVQPKHPDFVGWAWDGRQKVFWMMPGTMVASDDVCPGETTQHKDDPAFLLNKVMTFDPATRTWTDQTPKGYTAGPHIAETWMSVYDPARNEIIRFGFDGGTGGVANILSLTTKRWRVVGLGVNALGKEVRLNKEYLAADLAHRRIYGIDGLAGRLHRWDIDRRSLSDLGPVPGGSLGSENVTYPVWDSVNSVLLWYRDDGTFHVYHPDRRRWESVPVVKSPPEVRLRARAAVFDPAHNVLVLMGGLEPPNPYMFLYRYGPGPAPGSAVVPAPR